MKEFHKKRTKAIHLDKWKNALDKVIYGVIIFGPIMTIPQLAQIWINQNATGVSLISWTAYLIVAIFWLLYGVMHKEKPIIFANTIWVLLEIAIIAGIILYG